MAIPLKIGILYLIAEFTAHTLGILRALKPAGAVASLLLESLLYGLYYLLVFVKTNLHKATLLIVVNEFNELFLGNKSY